MLTDSVESKSPCPSVQRRFPIRCILGMAILSPLALGLLYDYVCIQALRFSPEPEGSVPINPYYGMAKWRNGTVGFADYGTYPGTNHLRAQWQGNGNDVKSLLDIGDYDGPTLSVLPDNRLEIRYSRYNRETFSYDTRMRAVFTNPLEPPVLERTEASDALERSRR